ncbi:MAG: hypothetical protein R3B70_13835 [Polyangiaceae bacterium]
MRFSMTAGRVFGVSPARLLLASFLVAAPALLAACVTEAADTADSAVDQRVRDVSFTHDDCQPDGSSKTVDVNGDNRPDIVHVMKDGREACRIVDLNFDGAVDVYIYYDDQGQERRREADFDRDGRPDQISILQGGQIIENRRETNFDDKLDTWDFYQGGVLVRRERDSDGDAIIDQWWTFYDPARPRCATVATDRNADGKPDADSQVDLCGQSYVSPTFGPAPPPGAPPPGAAPTASGAVPGTPVVPGPGAPPGPAATAGAAPAPSPVSPAPQ